MPASGRNDAACGGVGDGDGTGRGAMRGLTLGGGAGRSLSGVVGPSREIRALDVVYGARTHSGKIKMTSLINVNL